MVPIKYMWAKMKQTLAESFGSEMLGNKTGSVSSVEGIVLFR